VYQPGAYRSIEALADSIRKQLNNKGETGIFKYRKKDAAILELNFLNKNAAITGYGVCLELDKQKKSENAPFLLVLAYGAKESGDLSLIHLSCIDSIAPNAAGLRTPGPVTEYSYPRGKRKSFSLAGNAGEALFFEHDSEAAQFVIDREDMVLGYYAKTPLWKEAWKRFYRLIFRDSFERLQNAAFVLERRWNVPSLENRVIAGKALKWVQDFMYERDLEGSDFVNLVTAATEGRGDCDSRALLWAVILIQANVPAAIMVSAEYSHAMGLTDMEGEGARFPMDGKQWLVAETVAHVDIGLIAESVSNTDKWLGIAFE
jgi:hypothetical protein